MTSENLQLDTPGIMNGNVCRISHRIVLFPLCVHLTSVLVFMYINEEI